MKSSAARSTVPGDADDVTGIARHFSIEATFPTEKEIDALKARAPAGTRVYLACPPAHSPDRLVGYARLVRGAGFEPVPHLTARTYSDAAGLSAVLARLRGEADVQTALVIAGDRDDQAGPFGGALDLIESDALQNHGIREIGIAGYPDGHPKIADDALARALTDKLAAAARRELVVHIATQLCFDPQMILSWVRRLRAAGIDTPVRVGVAGPTSMRALLRFALRCGVRTSLKGALNPKAMQLLSETAPDEIIRTLGEAAAHEPLGALAIHYFSFGGLLTTADWAVAVAEARIEMKPVGFRVLR
jgi:methylenetetrahydrofolate reductase (NADPH)